MLLDDWVAAQSQQAGVRRHALEELGPRTFGREVEAGDLGHAFQEVFAVIEVVEEFLQAYDIILRHNASAEFQNPRSLVQLD